MYSLRARAALTQLCVRRIAAHSPKGWTHLCMPAFSSVTQQNPLGQVMWVSNPLEGYRIPSLSSAQFECARRDLGGPSPLEPRALSRPGVRVMESPHHGAPDPGSHPRIATEAAHSGACSPAAAAATTQRNPDVGGGGVLTHMFCHGETPRGRTNEGSAEMKTLAATLGSLLSLGLRMVPLLQGNSLKSRKTPVSQ